MTVGRGFSEAERRDVAAIYWAAFEGKLGRVLGPRRKAMDFIARVADPAHALTFRDPAGAVLGVAGFKTAQGAFVGGTLGDLAACYGWAGGTFRGLVLGLLERDTDERRFLTDGICVTEGARGRGVGTALLEGLAREAAARGYGEIRLDVIDRNPRARALYERRGFVAVAQQGTGLLGPVFGFRSATTMVRRLA